MKLFLSLVCVFSLCAQVPSHKYTYVGHSLAMHKGYQYVDNLIDEHNAIYKDLASKIRKPAWFYWLL